MIVIADTSPLNYLILIGEVEVLPQLYGRIIIPPAVQEELARPAAPDPVSRWIATPPHWLEVRSPSLPIIGMPANLGSGEREAIALAQSLRADQLLADDMTARREAERRGISVIGTLGVLREAAEEGLCDLGAAIERLRKTSFHISPEVMARLLGPSA